MEKAEAGADRFCSSRHGRATWCGIDIVPRRVGHVDFARRGNQRVTRGQPRRNQGATKGQRWCNRQGGTGLLYICCGAAVSAPGIGCRVHSTYEPSYRAIVWVCNLQWAAVSVPVSVCICTTCMCVRVCAHADMLCSLLLLIRGAVLVLVLVAYQSIYLGSQPVSEPVPAPGRLVGSAHSRPRHVGVISDELAGEMDGRVVPDGGEPRWVVRERRLDKQ